MPFELLRCFRLKYERHVRNPPKQSRKRLVGRRGNLLSLGRSGCQPLRTGFLIDRQHGRYCSVPKEIDSRPVRASRHLTDSLGEVNKNVRPKNSESSTAEHSAEASGNRLRNAATNFLDVSTP